MKKIIIFLTVLFTLYGCSSNSVDKTQYYLLNNNPLKTKSINNINHSNTQTQKAIYLNRIVLPDYLLQPRLVMKISTNQLHYAQYHLWAEALESSIPKVIINNLNQNSESYYLTQTNQYSMDHQNLTIQIDHFYPTHESKVILSGQYWLANQNQIPKNATFYFEKQLSQNGYAHAVSSMQLLLDELTQHLSQFLTQLK
ncbi:PqiC family protein [Aliikangiella sp. IMCC44359]|uniref:PqiC family protein n=1 Tax=Aliikangiella sp. IMCC44359 TaxID=3459125 RepID=UPI00403B0B32